MDHKIKIPTFGHKHNLLSKNQSKMRTVGYGGGRVSVPSFIYSPIRTREQPMSVPPCFAWNSRMAWKSRFYMTGLVRSISDLQNTDGACGASNCNGQADASSVEDMDINWTHTQVCAHFHTCDHIFQNAQVTSNKMVHMKRHYFLAQFSTPFHMVWSVLLRVLAQKATFWLVEILWQKLLFNGFWG